MTRQGRVTFVIDRFGEGGAQRSATMVATALHEAGVDVAVLAAKDGPFANELPREIPHACIAPAWPSARGVVQYMIGLRQWFRHADRGVVAFGGFAIGRLGLLAHRLGMLGRQQVVVVDHSTLSVVLENRFRRAFVRAIVLRITRSLYRRADAVVGVSEGVSRDLERVLGLAAGSVVTIHNPVDTSRLQDAIRGPMASDVAASFAGLRTPVVITAGRLSRQKAQSDLMHAFAALPDHLRGSLVILGEGPLRSELEQLTQELGLVDRVWMPGFVDNPWWFIARSDLFVLSSHWEGHPLILLEALACRVPVVSTDCPSGPNEILAGIPTARLAPPAEPNVLSQTMADLLANPSDTTHKDIDLSAYHPKTVAQHYTQLISAIRTAASI